MPFKDQFTGKRTIITGAGRGFGRALVKRLYSYGATIYAISKTQENLDTLKKECPLIETICLDLADWEEVREKLDKIEAVHCLVNNAAYLVVKSVMNSSPEDFDKILNVNLKSVMNTCQIIAKKMISAQIPGSIVNVSSVAGSRTSPLIGLYGTSKSALMMMSQCLAVELAPHKIRVNIFQPAGMDTDMFQSLSSGVDEMFQSEGVMDRVYTEQIPTGIKLLPIDECVNSALFLMSDLTTQIVGVSLAIDGGYLCG